MKKRQLQAIFASFLMATGVLAGCGAQEPAKKTEGEKQEQTDTAKEDAAEEVDFAKVTEVYTKNLQSLVQKRDSENEAQNDQQITAALKAGQDGSMEPIIARQIFDKLMQKVFYTTIKHEFTEIDENWGKKEEVKEEIEEAKAFYAIIQSTVEKRDKAYSTDMVTAIAGGFDEIEKAIEADDKLGFLLGKQAVDKTLMKTFYFATGAVPNGYATKAATAAKENAEEAKIEQAEGWAFYQALSSYLNKHAADEAVFIEKQFNLESDVTKLDPTAVNKAFVRGFAKIALDEYAESVETWGEDKSPVTALEGALFIDIIGADIKGIIGEAEYKTLTDNAAKYLEAAKAKDKAAGEPVLAKIKATLQTVIEKSK